MSTAHVGEIDARSTREFVLPKGEPPLPEIGSDGQPELLWCEYQYVEIRG